MQKQYVFWANVVAVTHALAVAPFVIATIVVCLAVPSGNSGWIVPGLVGVAAYGLVLLLLQTLFGGRCPLRVLEDRLRARADSNYTPQESFISYRLKRHFNIDVPPEMVTLATIVVTVLSGLGLVVTAIVHLA